MSATVMRAMLAFVVTMAIGLVLGLAAGRFEWVFDLIGNPLWVCMSVPSIVWVLIFLVSMGVGNVVPITALVVLLLPQATFNISEALRMLPREISDMSSAFHVTMADRVIYIYVPYVLPYFVAAMRVTFAGALRLVLITEVVGLSMGIGYLVQNAQATARMAPVIAWGIIFLIAGLAVDQAVFKRLQGSIRR